MANSTKILIVLCLLLLVIFSGSLAAEEHDVAALIIPSNALKGLQHNTNIEPGAERCPLSSHARG